MRSARVRFRPKADISRAGQSVLMKRVLLAIALLCHGCSTPADRLGSEGEPSVEVELPEPAAENLDVSMLSAASSALKYFTSTGQDPECFTVDVYE